MTALARFVIRHPRWIVALWAAAALCGACAGSLLNGRLENGGYAVPGSQSARAVALGREEFHDRAQAQAYISLTGNTGGLIVLLRDATRVSDIARRSHGVAGVGTAVISQSRRAALIPVMFDGSIGVAQTNAPGLERALRDASGKSARATLIGQVPVFNRYEVDAKRSLQRAAMIALPVTLVILLVAFLSVAAAVLPLILTGASVGVALGLLYLLTFVVQLNVFVEDTVLILGLGLSIDFSLFMVTRVRECLARGTGDVGDAIVEAMRTTGRAIWVSGLTVAVALTGLFAAGIGFLSSLAIGAIGATLVVSAAALTLTPAALAIAGDRLERLPLRAGGAIRSEAFWHWMAAFVTRRRWAIVVVVVPVMVVLSLPALGLNVRFRTYSILPGSDPVRRATSEVERTFGPGFGAPLVILAKTSGAHLEDVIDRQAGVAASAIAQRGAGRWSRLTAVLSAPPDSSAAEGAVRRLRVSLRRSIGASAVVGGPTAEGVDLADRINDRTPLVAVCILLVEMAFLAVAFRAPVISLKAAVTTVLSVMASLGILTLVFEGSGALAYFVPLFLIAAVFGLSTDYEIFLLSRVRECHLAGASTAESIQTALVRSGRSITLAGLSMSAVFFAFASSNLEPYRQLGFGLGLAVLLDVTVMRSLLVPAAVALLDEANWWRPGPWACRGRAPSRRVSESG